MRSLAAYSSLLPPPGPDEFVGLGEPRVVNPLGWANWTHSSSPTGPEVIHSVPVGDVREHLLDVDGLCWCEPTVDHECPELMYVHNSLDGRERYEDRADLRH